MKKIEFIMGMPVIVEIINNPSEKIFKEVFDYFKYVDEKFSPYKAKSEVTMINDKRLKTKNASKDMKLILKLSEKLKKETNGYFDIYTPFGERKYMDPSGIVKGWAIYQAAKILDRIGYQNYYINAGGDIQTSGFNSEGKKWAIGIRNPFNIHENVKVVYLSGEGIATSGIYEKGNHIYDPSKKQSNLKKSRLATPLRGPRRSDFLDDGIGDVVSLTVIGPNVYEADRFATPAFAMGKEGINFIAQRQAPLIEKQKDLEGYMIDSNKIATMTSGFEKYTHA